MFVAIFVPDPVSALVSVPASVRVAFLYFSLKLVPTPFRSSASIGFGYALRTVRLHRYRDLRTEMLGTHKFCNVDNVA